MGSDMKSVKLVKQWKNKEDRFSVMYVQNIGSKSHSYWTCDISTFILEN